MPFTIPNAGVASFPAQAMLNSTDLDIVTAGISGVAGVSTGCAVTTTGTGNGSVTVATGTVLVNGVYVTTASGNVAITANSSGNPRRDLITVDNTGAKSSVVGTPGAVPLLPAVPANRVVLADVYVPNGHSGSSTITAGAITDKRIFTPTSDFEAHNVIQYGAVGNSHHNTAGGADDTAAIQAAFDAAQAVGGFGVVVFPAGRTYRITDTIEVAPDPSKAPAWVWGVGSMGGNQVVQLPNIVWDGAADGLMFSSQASGNNLIASLFRNVRIAGRFIADTAIRFGPSGVNNAKIDTGTGLDEVHIAAFVGDAVRVEGIGLTNFWIRGGRWDQVDGYGMYVKIASQSTVSIRDLTYDNWVSTDPGHSKGFIHFDCAGNPDGSHVMCHFDTVHTETNADQIETNAAGIQAADKRGIIACTIEPTIDRVQFHLTLTNFQIQGWKSTNTSHCLIQMLGGDGATEADKAIQRSARLNVNGRMVRGLDGDGTATTGDVIPIGGIPTAHKSTFTGGTYNELIHAPTSGSDVFGSERPRRWSYVS